MSKITGKINYVANNVLINVGQAKTLSVPGNKFHEAPEKGAIVEFEGKLAEVEYRNTKTGEISEGKYLACPDFKLVSIQQPNVVATYKPLEQSDRVNDDMPFE